MNHWRDMFALLRQNTAKIINFFLILNKKKKNKIETVKKFKNAKCDLESDVE